MRHPLNSGFRALGVLALAAAAGCARAPSHPIEFILAIDASCQTGPVLPNYAASGYSAQFRLESHDQLRAYVFANACDLVYSGPRLLGRDRFNDCISQRLTGLRPDLARPGTHTELVLEQIAVDASRSTRLVAAVIETDGGIEDLSHPVRDRIVAAITRLEKSLNFKGLAVIGVDSQYRLQWEAWLRPLGARATVFGDRDGTEAISKTVRLAKEGQR